MESAKGPYRLVRLKELRDREIVHYADGTRLVTSRQQLVYLNRQGQANESSVALPEAGWKKLLGRSRLVRRALRWDKCNVAPVGKNRENLLILRNGRVYVFDPGAQQLHRVLRLRNCRNVLHQSVAVLGDEEIILGEYGSNRDARPVPVYRSLDGGFSWETVFEFPPGKTRHVHGCYWDPYEKKLWIFTGDADREVCVLVADREFKSVEWLGDGTQRWRAVSAFFTADHVYWITDSPLERNHLIKLHRRSRTTEKLAPFPGPVWYSKQTTDGFYLAATACETGPGVLDQYAHLLVSRNLEDWREAARFPWDGWPKGFFKFGVLGFADGAQSSREFYLFGEALRGLDGVAWQCSLEEA